MTQFQNIHGRKPGRGLRPWLLLPKVLCVAIYFGGVVAAAVLWVTARRLDLLVDQMWVLFVCVNVPALVLAIALGILLFFQHPRAFLRLRWFQVKLALIVVTVPAGHLFMSSRTRALRLMLASEAGDPRAIDAIVNQVSCGFVVLIAATCLIVVLGRLKPRLGQNWARDFPKE